MLTLSAGINVGNSEKMGAETNTNASPGRVVGKPFKPGQSGNPNGRPRIEPRVRRYARRYDRKMCRTLAEIATDPKVPASERRRAAMDLIAVGSGRPALVQEIGGRGGGPVGPLVNINMGLQPGGTLAPEQAYKLMVEGHLEADPAIFERPAIDMPASPASSQEVSP